MRAAACLLALSICAALAGCSTEGGPTTTPPVGTTPTATSPPATTTPPAGTTPQPTGTTPPPTGTTTPPTQPGTQPVATTRVTMSANAFEPASILVTRGATVTWTNADDPHHTVTLDDGTYDSGTLPPGSTHSKNFETLGTFAYHCDIHPSMRGTVTVADQGPAPTPTTPTPPAENATVRVSIADFAYSPTPLTIRVGTTVVWNNSDFVAHTVTSDQGQFDSGGLLPQREFSHTFTRVTSVGVFYHCTFHTEMRGTIQVTS